MRAKQTAFVGDIHGNLAALNGIAELLLNDADVEKIVFMGDYINRGRNSAGVIDRLLEMSLTSAVTVLRGNHETEMLVALDSGDLATFLKRGGASTIRSYVRHPVSPDVLRDFRTCLPTEHVQFLRSMPNAYETPELIASHQPRIGDETRFQISAHIPVGLRPIVDPRSAQLDTNCGYPTGRLTAFYWPSKTYLQVDSDGRLIENDAD